MCVHISTGGRVVELLLEDMRKVKFRTMKELYGGTKEEFEEPTKACTFAASLCLFLNSYYFYGLFCVWFLFGFNCHGFGFQVVIFMKFIV